MKNYNTLICLTLFCLLACSEKGFTDSSINSEQTNNNQIISLGPITVTLNEVTASTANFLANIDIDLMEEYQEVGFLFSPTKDLDVDNKNTSVIVVNKESYIHTFKNLRYDTEYFYTIFTLRNNIYSYSKIQSFKTKDIVINIDDVQPTHTTITFTGSTSRLNVDNAIEIGIMYSENMDFSSQSTEYLKITPNDEHTFNVKLENCIIGKEYHYRSYKRQNGEYEFCDAQSVMTKPIDVSLTAESVTQTSAKFAGTLSPATAINEIDLNIIIGHGDLSNINYEIKRTISTSDFTDDGYFSVTIDGLLYNRSYSYSYYIPNYSVIETQKIRMKDVPLQISANMIDKTEALISGNIVLDENSPIEIGVLYSSSESSLTNIPTYTGKIDGNRIKLIVDNTVNVVVLNDIINTSGDFIYSIQNIHETTYFCYYILQYTPSRDGIFIPFKISKPQTIQ